MILTRSAGVYGRDLGQRCHDSHSANEGDDTAQMLARLLRGLRADNANSVLIEEQTRSSSRYQSLCNGGGKSFPRCHKAQTKRSQGPNRELSVQFILRDDVTFASVGGCSSWLFHFTFWCHIAGYVLFWQCSGDWSLKKKCVMRECRRNQYFSSTVERVNIEVGHRDRHEPNSIELVGRDVSAYLFQRLVFANYQRAIRPSALGRV